MLRIFLCPLCICSHNAIVLENIISATACLNVLFMSKQDNKAHLIRYSSQALKFYGFAVFWYLVRRPWLTRRGAVRVIQSQLIFQVYVFRQLKEGSQ